MSGSLLRLSLGVAVCVVFLPYLRTKPNEKRWKWVSKLLNEGEIGLGGAQPGQIPATRLLCPSLDLVKGWFGIMDFVQQGP